MIPHGPHVRWTILLHSQKSKGRAVDAWAVLRLGSLTAQLQLINTPQLLGWELDFWLNKLEFLVVRGGVVAESILRCKFIITRIW